MNPNSKDDINRLTKAVAESRKRLKVFREKRRAAIKDYVGFNYSDDGSPKHMPINLIELAVNIYQRQLAARSPRLLIGTDFPQLRPFAADLQFVMNKRLDVLNFGAKLTEAVVDALFGDAIVKVGLQLGRPVQIEGQARRQTDSYVDVVSPDDWVHDMTAKKWEQVTFMGNRYRVPLADVQKNEKLRKSVRSKLEPTTKGSREGGPMGSGEERTEELSQGRARFAEEYVDHVELWDIWLPRESRVLTLSHGDPMKLLRETKWDGPAHGPYHRLSFNNVPDNVMGLPPVALWLDMNKLANRLFRKLRSQAQRAKTVTGVQGGADDDGNRVLNASDGEMIKLDNPDMINQFKTGGVDTNLLLFLMQVKDLFVYLGGNLDALGGLATQAETLGQERLLSASASRRLADMQDRTATFARNICYDIARYEWDNPFLDESGRRPVPNTPVEVGYHVTAENRLGRFLQYNFDIEPFSMRHLGPHERLQAVGQVIGQFVAPFAPMLQQQGIAVDFQRLFQLVSQWLNMPELAEILTYTEPMAGREPLGGGKARQSPVTKRTYERVNRPGSTRRSKDDALMARLLGAGRQPSEQAPLVRNAG